ncbi:MAG: hypothetical protein M1838_003246 [Thelocarpon superellum]|nr:MAG: hypothetical protein M1838_003246 [Thelocarpon superellum]
MTQHPYKESDLVLFDDVVAGHDGVLSDVAGEVVIKPCTPAEISFYESANAFHPAVAAYMPTFMGQLELSPQQSLRDPTAMANAHLKSVQAASEATGPRAKNESQSHGHGVDHGAGASPEAPLQPQLYGFSRGRKLDTNVCIVLSNAAADFYRPNVLDVKLGSVMCDSSAEPMKRARLEKVAADTTSSSLGFRISGMKVWQGHAAEGDEGLDAEGYRVFGKMYGRSFDAKTVVEGFEDFLFVERAGITQAMGQAVARKLRREIEGIRSVLEGDESRMYGASILCVYEGDPQALDAALQGENELELRRIQAPTHQEKDVKPPRTITEYHDHENDSDDDEGHDEEESEQGSAKTRRSHVVKLIDFAHASWTPGQGRDENVLKGVRNVSSILDEFGQGRTAALIAPCSQEKVPS